MEVGQFTEWAERYMDMVYRIALNCVRSQADAEDVVQNVMLRFYQSAKPFESEEHVRYWLCRVAVNESRRLMAAPWKHRVTALNEAFEGRNGTAEEGEVMAAVAALPTKYRLPLYLYYFEGYSVDEIGRILGRNSSTVQTHLARARDQLRTILKEE